MSAKKQPTVVRSSCESEYQAMTNVAAELVWISNLLKEPRALPSSQPTMSSENKSAIFFGQNSVAHK